MKYTIQAFITILLLFSLSINSFSQEVSKKMKRDIEVAEDVLESLWKTEEDNPFNLAGFAADQSNFEGTYMGDYGVIFSSNINSSGLIHLSGQANMNRSYRDAVRIYRDNGEGLQEIAQVEEVPATEEPAKVENAEDEVYGYTKNRFEKMAFEFLGNYSSIISGLENGEKLTVQINIKSDDFNIVYRGQSQRKDPSQKFFSATAKKEDMDAYQAERLTAEQFMERIDFSSEEDVEVKEPELELLASMIHRLYKKDLTNSFALRRAPRYERLKGFGVIYYLDFTKSSNQYVWRNNGETFTLDNQGSEMDSYEVSQKYESLEKELPEQMIDYGRLLKKMKPGEKLVFKAILPTCKGCNDPSSLEYSVSQETLQAYNKNRMSLEKAIESMSKLLGGEE